MYEEMFDHFYGMEDEALDDIYVEKWQDLLGQMASIHPDVKFGKNVRVGRNTIIEAGCEIGDNSLIGHHCVLRPGVVTGINCLIGHLSDLEGNITLGNHVAIQPQCHIPQGVIFEDNSYVGVMCALLETHRIRHVRNFPLGKDPPYIEYGARIGSMVVIMPGVRIGRESLIAAGSVVTRDCEPFWIYMGRPAKKVRPVPEEERLING